MCLTQWILFGLKAHATNILKSRHYKPIKAYFFHIRQAIAKEFVTAWQRYLSVAPDIYSSLVTFWFRHTCSGWSPLSLFESHSTKSWHNRHPWTNRSQRCNETEKATRNATVQSTDDYVGSRNKPPQALFFSSLCNLSRLPTVEWLNINQIKMSQIRRNTSHKT